MLSPATVRGFLCSGFYPDGNSRQVSARGISESSAFENAGWLSCLAAARLGTWRSFSLPVFLKRAAPAPIFTERVPGPRSRTRPSWLVRHSAAHPRALYALSGAIAIRVTDQRRAIARGSQILRNFRALRTFWSWVTARWKTQHGYSARTRAGKAR